MSRRGAPLALALVMVAVLALGLGGAAAGKKTKHRKRLARVPATLVLNQTPVQSGTVTAGRACRGKRYIEIRRVDNNALVASATSGEDGRFGAPGGYSGDAYAFAQATRHGKVRCLEARSAVVRVGVADLEMRQVAVPSAETGGHPAFDLIVASGGPDAAQNVIVISRPVAQPFGGSFGLDAARTSSGCTLAGVVITCRIASVFAGKPQTRRIALTCSGLTLNFRNTATVNSSARDPSGTNDTSNGLSSSNCT